MLLRAVSVFWLCVAYISLGLTLGSSSKANEPWGQGLRFYASFDENANADWASGDSQALTAATLKRERVTPGLHLQGASIVPTGRYQGCLEFGPKSGQVLFYRGADTLPATTGAFDLSVSMWMQLSPDSDLAPGYVDPLQITDKTWNDASLFLDFTKDEVPRHFRLGLFSDYKFWNPENIDWEKLDDAKRPLVTLKSPPFKNSRWTHVVITIANANGEGPATASLYLDGELQGILLRPQQISWDPTKLVIMLGIHYTGKIDEFAIWDRCLTPDETQQLSTRQQSLKQVVQTLK
ncbi:LamG-like jellyroll fold domain-containing protein [Planctomycetaceae bacterium SH139]